MYTAGISLLSIRRADEEALPLLPQLPSLPQLPPVSDGTSSFPRSAADTQLQSAVDASDAISS